MVPFAGEIGVARRLPAVPTTTPSAKHHHHSGLRGDDVSQMYYTITGQSSTALFELHAVILSDGPKDVAQSKDGLRAAENNLDPPGTSATVRLSPRRVSLSVLRFADDQQPEILLPADSAIPE